MVADEPESTAHQQLLKDAKKNYDDVIKLDISIFHQL